jgi:hypothetical protein
MYQGLVHQLPKTCDHEGLQCARNFSSNTLNIRRCIYVREVETDPRLLNPSFTDLVQNVPRPGIFLNVSRWCRETFLPIFLFVQWSHTDTTLSSFGTYLFLRAVWFFQIQLDHFIPILVKKSLKYVFCQNALHKSSNTQELQDGHHKQPYCTAD